MSGSGNDDGRRFARVRQALNQPACKIKGRGNLNTATVKGAKTQGVDKKCISQWTMKGRRRC